MNLSFAILLRPCVALGGSGWTSTGWMAVIGFTSVAVWWRRSGRPAREPRDGLVGRLLDLDEAGRKRVALNYKRGSQIPNALAQSGWISSLNGLNGQPEAICRYGQLKAYDADADGDPISSARLVGHSVWNTRWLLIIPGRRLFSDAAEGIERFIDGRVIDTPTGERDHKGVTDIRRGDSRHHPPEATTNLAFGSGHEVSGFANVAGNNHASFYNAAGTNVSFFSGQVWLEPP